MSHELTHDGMAHTLRMPHSRLGKLLIANVPYLILYAIAIVLIAMTDSDPLSAKPSWGYFIPLIGVVSALSGWSRYAGRDWEQHAQYLLKQVLHWGALLLVIRLLFLTDVQHFLRAEDDGFVIVYLVGLTSILAGIYLDWKMAIFGLFLISSGVVIAFLDDNVLLLTLGGMGLAAVIVTALLWIRFQSHSGALERSRSGRTGSH